MADWGGLESFEWVEIIEPSRREHMFANLKTGQCLWDPPEGVSVKPTHENQWWELYDTNTRRYYYYNATSQKTVWRQPKDGDIIPLAKLQMLKAKEVRRKSSIDKTAKPVLAQSKSPEQTENISVDNQQNVEKQEDIEASSNDEYMNELNKRNSQNENVNDVNKIESDDDDPVYENYDPTEHLNAKQNLERTENSNSVEKLDNKEIQPEEVEDTEEEESFYENVNFTPPVEKNNQEDCTMDNVPSGGFINSKSSTLPRTGTSQKVAPKPKYNSFRTKAPPKPPRITSNESFKISLEKSPPADASNDDAENENKENISNVNNGYNISVQSSPRLGTRSVSKPVRPPPIAPNKTPSSLTISSPDDSQKQFSTSPSTPSTPVSPTPEQPPLSPYSSHQPVPDAPPPPKIAAGVQRQLPSPDRFSNSESTLSVYDNVRSALSMYDNLSDNDETPKNNTSTSTSPPRRRHTSGSSDDNTTPSGTLLRSETAPGGRASYYERLNDEEETPSSSQSPRSPRQLPTAPESERSAPESERSAPVKRSPLTRMKSDSSDMEKRPKFSSTADVAQQFRPVSMMNLSTASLSQTRTRRLASEADIPETVPLSTHRTGLFRRRMSIHSMLSWSKSAIKKPMVLSSNKQQRKDAVEVFKLILQCMGDKSSRKSSDALLVDITTRGWSTAGLRDEIFIQLCKQTTGNDKPTSLKRGWELLTSCLSIFPPSNKFHSYLEGYISRNMDAEDLNPQAQVDMYAKYCYKQLEKICQTGAKRGLKGPTVDEIHAAIKRVFNPSMFGNSLEDIMEMQTERYPDHRLPWILTTLTDAVLLQNGLQTEGIFRVPGDIDDVNSLKLLVDSWQLPQHITDPYVPGSLLKLWFRDLYEPLIPQRFYDQCIHNCDNQDICLNIVASLPPLNNLVFSYLIRLLQAFMIRENVSISKMDENNLAMVWAPNCLRCPSDDPREIFENTRKEMTFLRTVMKCLDTTFLEGVV